MGRDRNCNKMMLLPGYMDWTKPQYCLDYKHLEIVCARVCIWRWEFLFLTLKLFNAFIVMKTKSEK